MVQDNLKQKTKKGLYWSALGNFANQGIRFVFGLILARLLSPDAYGIIGMLTVFMCVIQVFIDCGFSQALIAKQDRTQIDFSTEFFFNIIVGFAAYMVLFISAPFIAAFYNMPELSTITRVIGVGVIINSLCVVQSAQFSIKLDFKTPAKIGFYTQFFSGIIGIILAYCGFGVWALVFQQILGGILNAILLWLFAGWFPSLVFSHSSFKYLWNYGNKILGASLIQQIYDNIYPLVIGKFFNASSLGLYSRAQGFASLPSTNLSGIIGNVSFPVLAKLGNDKESLVKVYRKMIKTTAFLVFPLMIGMAAVASPTIKVLLNEQWNGCIIMLQLLCFALIWNPLSSLQLNVIKVIGRTDIIFKLEIYKRSFGLLTIFASIPFGVVGMCIGFDIFYIFCFILNTIYINRVLKMGFKGQIYDVLIIFINSAVMGLIVFGLTFLPVFETVKLLLGIIVGCIYYYISSKYFFKDTLDSVLTLIKTR